MPQQVYQNTMAECILINISRIGQFVSISEENCNNIDNIVYSKVTNFAIKHNAKDLLKSLRPS